MKAEPVELEYGFIGISRGDKTINAIIWGGGDDFYFLPVDEATATKLEAWDAGDRYFRDLFDIMPPMTSREDYRLLFEGTVY